jgi:sigma-E factor negative regulatory protein RseB
MTAVDEVGRQVIRRGDEVTAILPDRGTVLVDRRDGAALGPEGVQQRLPGLVTVPAAHYRLAVAAGPELLGRPTREIRIRPMDALRYGYQLWLDQATALPLKVQLVDEAGAVLEQVVFSDLRIGTAAGPAPDAANARRVPGAPAAVLPAGRGTTPAAARKAGSATTGWAASRLPPGFALQAARAKPGAVAGATLAQLVYGDGVATVSVFVEPDAAGGADSAARVGADSIYTRFVAGHRVTAMGEVPLETAEMIAAGIRPVALATAGAGPTVRQP